MTRVLVTAFLVSIAFAILATTHGAARTEPAHSRGGHALTVDRHGVGGGVVSALPAVTG